MPFFSKVFRGNKDSAPKQKPSENGTAKVSPPKPRWDDAWLRNDVEPEEVQELIRYCTHEIKARALNVPFLILPFRPASDPSAAKTFIRNFFGNGSEKNLEMQGSALSQELKLVEPMVLCSVLKWCWSRLSGGVVTWEVYELFQIGEEDSNQARDAFTTFVPMSVGSDARAKIIFDFFELLAAIAAHGKVNGLGGRKLSRLAGWWAFEHTDTASGFDGGYKNWSRAADATSHLFFAYLRSLTPESSEAVSGISTLPRSLQALLFNTEYPPLPQEMLQARTSKVVMVVETVSPTPFALLRRAKNFQYRDEDFVLQQFSDFDDPVEALTDECRRVLRSISTANDLSSAKTSTSLKDPSWSRFEDIGFGSIVEDSEADGKHEIAPPLSRMQQPQGLMNKPMSKSLNRPTTPSWADFLSSGFVDEKQPQPTLLLPPDKILPPINLDVRGHSSQSHRRNLNEDYSLEPGELANIATFSLDDAFWWVWISSLAGEEPPARKAVFGRCALIETRIHNSWLVMEEIIKGAAPEPEVGAYVAEKKSRFGFSKRSKVSRTKSTRAPALPTTDPIGRSNESTQPSKTSIAPDQRSRIQAAAAALQEKKKREASVPSPRRGRQAEDAQSKAASTLTLQPVIMKEAAPAMKWASSYDKNAIRTQYLGNTAAGRGSAVDLSEFLSGSRNETPTPAPAERSNVATPMAETPQASEAPGQNGVEGTQNTAKESTHQNGEASNNRTADSFFAAQLPTSPPSTAPLSRNENQSPVDSAAEPKLQLDEKPGVTNQPHAPIERKALVSVQQKVNAQRFEPSAPPKTPDQPEDAVALSSISPESPRNKLKKKNQQTGFKGMFGRKKEEPPKTQKPAPRASPSSSSVAAARAALEAKAKQNQAASPPPPISKVTNKRYSALGTKGPIEESAAAASAALTAQTSGKPAAETSETSNVPHSEPVAAAAAADQRIQIQDVSPAEAGQRIEIQQSAPEPTEMRPSSLAESQEGHFDHNEKQYGGHAQPFNQGPLDDNPFNVQDDSARASTIQEHETASETQPHPVMQKEASPPQTEEQSAETTDRWAQIRKNAAERAARMSEEQSGLTDRTDEGETSGEETIESRVARIKARVAELTGNMETNGSPRA